MQQPVILDFDHSVLPVSDAELRIRLQDWQEDIRFGCSFAHYARLKDFLQKLLPEKYGPVFTGSGDYHHVTLLLLQNLAHLHALPPLSVELVVADNHPDNMRYFFGLHCGSWVRHAAALDCIRHIHVLGINSADITLKHAYENYLGPFWQKKLTYWSVNRNASWLRLFGRGAYAGNFATADELLAAFLPVLRESADNSRGIYLSIDKDVLSPDVVQTNWDQGVFALRHLDELIAHSSGRLLGADICGDVSAYAFRALGKRLLLRLESQPKLDPEKMKLWQLAQQNVNKKLLAAF